MSTTARESRLRRLAHKQGYVLRKSRTREPRRFDFGLWAIIDPDTSGSILPSRAGTPYAYDLDEVEEWLSE